MNLVYIVSNGRSGSTLLDLLLGAHPDAITVGEIHILPWELKLGGVQPCACGLPVPECPFWKDVTNEVRFNELKGTPIEFFRQGHERGKVLRPKLLRQLLFTPKNNDPLNQKTLEYGYNNYLLFKAVLFVAHNHFDKKSRWLVDSSKDFYRLIWLQRSGYFNIKIIHLVKDPRAFVYSMTKTWLINKSGSTCSPKIIRKTVRMAGRWLVENSLINLACRREFNPNQVAKLRYEDLAAHPEESLTSICNFLGWRYTHNMLEDFRTQACHAIAGNIMRYETTGISLDEKWRDHLPKVHTVLSRIITYPMQRRLGY